MSSWSDRDDLHVRIEQGLVSRYGPNVVETFPDSPLPGWLQMPLMLLDLTTTGEQMAAIVLNVEGRSLDQALCVVMLADLERLLQATDGGARGAVEDLLNG